MISLILALVGLVLCLKGLVEARRGSPSWPAYTVPGLAFTALSVAM